MKSKCTSYLREIVDLFSVYPLANTDAENSSTFLNYFILFSGASAHKPCIFPFKFNGVVYSQCTWVSAHLTEHKVRLVILLRDNFVIFNIKQLRSSIIIPRCFILCFLHINNLFSFPPTGRP